MIHLAVPICEYFGAGTCGKYLAREFSKRRGVVLYDRMNKEEPDGDVEAPLIQFGGPELEQQTKHRGNPNVGYIFSEWQPITQKQKENLKAFDVLIAGSKWNAEVIREAGFECVSVPQGVDRDIFKPEHQWRRSRFVIYSGGKLESRKGQDLVIRAVKVLQQRHWDIFLVASWVNAWDTSDPYPDIDGIRGLPLLDHQSLAAYMNQTDVGLFPNRCEGGTNLVMMQYLACGKPVIANVSTGQRDVLDESYSIFMEGDDDSLVEQMIEGVEKFYQDRQTMRAMGEKAGVAMDSWPWSRTADGMEAAIG